MSGWLLGVLGNLTGDAITGATVYLTRHRWMPLLVAFHHRHKQLHAARLEQENHDG